MSTKAAVGVAAGLSVALLVGGAVLAFSVVQGMGARERHPWAESAEAMRIDLSSFAEGADRSWRRVAGTGVRLAGHTGELVSTVQARGWGWWLAPLFGAMALTGVAWKFGRSSTTAAPVGTRSAAGLAQDELIRRFARGLSDAILLLDTDRSVHAALGSVLAILHERPEALRGRPLRDLAHPDDAVAVDAFLDACRTSPKTSRATEFRLHAPEGRWCRLEVFGNTRRGDPDIDHLMVRIQDVTERRQADEALHDASETLRSLLEASPLAIVLEDRDGRVKLWNTAAERIFGWDAQEIIGQPSPEVGPDQLDEHRNLRDRVLGGETLPAVEAKLITKAGDEIEASMSAAPLFDATGEGIGVMKVMVDITERKQLEAQLRQAQKMEAVGRLAGGIAHDFNNVLTAIVGYADLAVDQLDRDRTEDDLAGEPERESHESVRHAVQEIQKAADRAATLTKGLLAFSRSQVMQPTILDLNTVIENMESMLQPIIGEEVELATFSERHLGQVRVDRSQIEQVIMNLVVNAKDAMPEGGKLTIETANVELDEHYARRRAPVMPGSYVMLAVSDSGCGMDAETEARLFEPFFTTKERGKGTGLGLSTAYGIVRQSGGHIWVYTERGKGSTFKIYLPRVTSEVSRPTSERPVEVPPPTGSETVLLVEDEEMIRTLVRQVLTWHGYHVIDANNGEQALRVAEQYRGPIDLMLTDVVMPGMSAPDLVAKLGALRPAMKVLYMSGYTDHAIARHGLLNPAQPFLQKPSAPNRLAHKVRQVLNAPRAVLSETAVD